MASPGVPEICEWDVSSSMQFSGSFAYLCFLLFVGVQIRRIALVRVIFLPASLIAGILGLILKLIVDKFPDNYPDDPACNSKDIFTNNFMSFWGRVPGIAINIVFACIFLGKNVPTMKEAWHGAGPQLMYGQIKAWGSWFWCCITGLIICYSSSSIPDVITAMFCVGFEGGHGTAGGLQEKLGPKYYNLAVTSATIGIILGCTLGTVFVNIGTSYKMLNYQKIAEDRKQKITKTTTMDIERAMVDSHEAPDYKQYNTRLKFDTRIPDWNSVSEPDHDAEFNTQINADGFRGAAPMPSQFGDRDAAKAFSKYGITMRIRNRLEACPKDVLDIDARLPAGFQTIRSEALDSLAFQLVHVGMAIGIGYGIVRILALIDLSSDSLKEYEIFGSFPLFPMCMLGGIIIEIIYNKLGVSSPVDGSMMNFISGTSIEFLCLTAIATMNVKATGGEVLAFTLILLTGIVWQITCFWVIAPRVLPDSWFERAIVEFGMGFGTTSIGLLLLRMADPLRLSTAWDSFSYKQMLHEPFMGGGIWTTFAVIFLTMWAGGDKETQTHLGIWIVFVSSIIALSVWISLYFLYFKKLKPSKTADKPESKEFISPSSTSSSNVKTNSMTQIDKSSTSSFTVSSSVDSE